MNLLEEILDWSNLCAAWESVADNHGSPGPDGVNIYRFGRFWGANLHTLRELVRSNRYKPGGLRRVAIPKQGGGERLLCIPNVGDRVLQRAALNVLQRDFESQFLPCSHGYRPQRGVRTALTDLLRLRDRGCVCVLDADIDDCFGSLDHQLLRQMLADTIEDGRVLQLLDRWIRQGRSRRHPDRGIALGMPVSPLLCNVYLHRMDFALTRRRWRLVRYADDFVICCRTEESAQRAHRVAAEVLAELRLQLEPSKTCVTSFDAGFEFLGIRFDDNEYRFLWKDKRLSVEHHAPHWLWEYLPAGYDG